MNIAAPPRVLPWAAAAVIAIAEGKSRSGLSAVLQQQWVACERRIRVVDSGTRVSILVVDSTTSPAAISPSTRRSLTGVANASAFRAAGVGVIMNNARRCGSVLVRCRSNVGGSGRCLRNSALAHACVPHVSELAVEGCDLIAVERGEATDCTHSGMPVKRRSIEAALSAEFFPHRARTRVKLEIIVANVIVIVW